MFILAAKVSPFSEFSFFGLPSTSHLLHSRMNIHPSGDGQGGQGTWPPIDFRMTPILNPSSSHQSTVRPDVTFWKNFLANVFEDACTGKTVEEVRVMATAAATTVAREANDATLDVTEEEKFNTEELRKNGKIS